MLSYFNISLKVSAANNAKMLQLKRLRQHHLVTSKRNHMAIAKRKHMAISEFLQDLFNSTTTLNRDLTSTGMTKYFTVNLHVTKKYWRCFQCRFHRYICFFYSGPPEDFKFDGYVEIYLICNKATDKMYLHLNQLEIDNSTIMFRAVDDNVTPPGDYQIFIILI